MPKKYQHFIPRGDGDRGSWFANFGEKIATYGPLLGLTAEQVTKAQEACIKAKDKITKVTLKFQEYQEAVSAKNLLASYEQGDVMKIAGILKLHPDYTENIGRDLGIVGSSTNIDLNYLKPVLKAETFPGFVSVTFNKQLQLRICLYARLKGTTGWELLGRPNVSPFEDRRSLPAGAIAETREYMGVFWDGDKEYGQQSDIVYTLFGG